jgi:hypothetical protein
MPLRALAPELAAQLTGGSMASAAVAAPHVAPTHAAPQKKSRAGVAVGALVALGALAAAGGFVYMKSSSSAEPAATTVAQAEAPKAKAEAPQAKAEGEAKPVAVAQADAPSTASDSVDPMALPEAHQAARGGSAPHAAAKAAAPAAAPAHEAPAPKTAAAKPAAKSAGAAPAPSEPAGPAGALGDAMRQAAGPTDPSHAVSEDAPKPKFAPGSVPSKPSQGAVTGAIGSVLPTARDCVGPDAPISRAAVVFGSSGAVKEVRVSGYAKGKKAEQCIVSAMQKASLPPFAEDSYTANVTIRH